MTCVTEVKVFNFAVNVTIFLNFFNPHINHFFCFCFLGHWSSILPIHSFNEILFATLRQVQHRLTTWALVLKLNLQQVYYQVNRLNQQPFFGKKRACVHCFECSCYYQTRQFTTTTAIGFISSGFPLSSFTLTPSVQPEFHPITSSRYYSPSNDVVERRKRLEAIG